MTTTLPRTVTEGDDNSLTAVETTTMAFDGNYGGQQEVSCGMEVLLLVHHFTTTTTTQARSNALWYNTNGGGDDEEQHLMLLTTPTALMSLIMISQAHKLSQGEQPHDMLRGGAQPSGC